MKSVYVTSNPEWTALLTQGGSAIRKVTDLKGKRIVATRGTDPHIFLIRTLAANGLTEKDVRVVLLQHQDGRLALAKGDVDAWAGLDPLMAQRPSILWGGSGGPTIWAFGPPLSGGMVLVEGAVHNRGPNLEHQMCPMGRPSHLLVGIHPAVQQPLHRALRSGRRDRLLAAAGRRVVNDDVGLPGHVSGIPSF